MVEKKGISLSDQRRLAGREVSFATCTSPFLGAYLLHPQDPTRWLLWHRQTTARTTCRGTTTGKRRRQQPEAAAESECESDRESNDDELTQEELDELDALDGRGHLRPNQVSVWSIVSVPVVALAHRG